MKLSLAFFALLAVAAGACQQRTEIVLGVVTDLRAPTQMNTVELRALRNGTPIIDRPWMLGSGQPELPGSFGIYSGDGSETAVELTLKGFLGTQLVVERDATVSLVGGRTLLMRLALVASCAPGPTCTASETCIEGVCRGKAADARRFPDFAAPLVGASNCDSGSHFIVASTGSPMPSLGAACPAGDFCQEGLCYHGDPSTP